MNMGSLGGFERTFSVDDLVGGIWRLGQAGIARTDSEAAFQDFLKKIPSASNLAALTGASNGQLNTMVESFSAANGGVGAGDNAATAAATIASLGGGAAAGGMPRVPSLDFLRALVVNQQYGAPVKVEQPIAANGPGSLTALSPADLASISAAALQAVPNLTAAALQAVPALSAAQTLQNNAAAAAAAIQLQNLNQHAVGRYTGNGATSSAPMSSDGRSGGEGDNDDKAEARRARRMLSNRESARRSRRRKQEHLSKLETELNIVAESKKEVQDKVQTLERRCTTAEDENRRLREENDRLRDELRFLRSEISERKERLAGRGREADAPVGAEDEQPAAEGAKRQKTEEEPAAAKEKAEGKA